jgi:hypothetical protein
VAVYLRRTNNANKGQRGKQLFAKHSQKTKDLATKKLLTNLLENIFFYYFTKFKTKIYKIYLLAISASYVL